MLRISKLTDYGTMVLACLATRPDQRHTAAAVAERTRLGLPPVSKLLKSFHKAGIVTSTRGAHGGYQLARPASGISAAEIIDAIEGPVAITECSGIHSACDLETICSTGSAWQRVNAAIRKRVLTLLKAVGIKDKFVITGGIARNVGVVARIGEKVGGIKVNIPPEPMIAGAVGAALFAFDRARMKASA